MASNEARKKTNNPPTRLAVAGLGLVGKRHAEVIGLLDECELVGAVEPGEDGQAFARENDIPCFETVAALFAQQEPEGIVLATPTPLHTEQGLECIKIGVPALIEKPIAVTAEDAMKLVIASEKKDVPLLVGHHRRHNPLIQKAKEVLEAGQIGDLRAVHAQCWFYKPDHYFDIAPWRKQHGAGPVSVNLVHDIDLVRYLCGEVVSVQAQAAPSLRGFENEDVSAAVLRFENGAIGTITVSDSIVAPWSWEMTARENPVYPTTSESCYLLGGSHGSLSLPDLRVWAHEDGKQDWWSPIAASSIPRHASDPLHNQIAHFVEVIRGGAQPLVSGREGFRSLQVVEAIQTAAMTGETVAIDLGDPGSPAGGKEAAE